MIVVGIGDYKVTNNVNETIITHSLGSCLAVIVHCPVKKLTAMAHVVLPVMERVDQNNYHKERPGFFAEKIVPYMLDTFINYYKCPKEKLQVVLIGGAKHQSELDVFQIGPRNVEVTLKVLKEYNIKPHKIDVGGYFSRTVEVHSIDGIVTVQKRKMII